jgi:hypothetical protein
MPNNPKMQRKLARALSKLEEAQLEIAEAFALQGAGAASTYKWIDKAFNTTAMAMDLLNQARGK